MKNTLLTFYFSIVTLGAVAQDTISVRTFGGPYNDYGNDLIETSDGGYAIIGTTGSYWQNQSNMYLLKLNASLEKEWSQVFGGNNVEWGQSIVETEDGFLLLGYTNSFGAGGYDIYLVKCDFNGDFIWQKTYGGSDWDFGYKILEYDGDYYIAGESWSFSNGSSDGYLMQIDDSGEIVWSDHFGGIEEDAFYDLFMGAEGIVAVGYNNSTGTNKKLFAVNFIDHESVNEHIIGEDGKEFIGTTGLLHSNGEYYFSGSVQLDESPYYLFLRTDTNFNLLPVDNGTFGLGQYPDLAYSIIEVDNDQITLVGESSSYTESIGAFTVRADVDGNYIAGPTHGGGGSDIGRKLLLNSENELLLLGETNSYGEGNYDVYLLQWSDNIVDQQYTVNELFNSDSLLTSTNEQVSESHKPIFHPNPAKTYIELFNDGWESIQFFNAKGQLVSRINLDPNQQIISLQDISKGMYILELSKGKDFHRERLIVE